MIGTVDNSLRDEELAAEVELTAALIAAANGSATPLSPAEIDRVLGLR